MMKFVVMWLNDFPFKSEVPKTYSPRTIMTGTTLDWTKHCKTGFGAYCEVHEEHSTMTKNWIYYARTRSAICFGPTSNFQGSYNSLCLKTVKRISHNQFTVFPMPESVVKQVEELSTINTQFDEGLTFEDHDNIPIEGSDNTTEGAATTGVELEIPGVEVKLGTPGVEIGIKTPGVENPNINEEDAETENDED